MVMMTRRIIRSLGQLIVFVFLICILIFFADSRYRVLPAVIHNHLPSHHIGTVITDVTVAFCSSTNPFSRCQLEGWERIPKDLYLGTGWVSSAWLHVKRKREEDLTSDDRVVMDITISDFGLSASDKQHWEKRPAGMWVSFGTTKEKSDMHHAVTSLDVLFGGDAVDPRQNWHVLDKPLLINGVSDYAPRLSVRSGTPKTDARQLVPRVRKDGRFKILQVSDLHLSTGLGKCRDAIDADGKPSAKCDADPRTLEFVESILDDEKPDLVLLTGDQVEGPAAPDTQSAIYKAVAPLIERKIPWAAIFGNHDDEGSESLSRETQMSIMQHLPFSLSQPGMTQIDGVGNYYIEVLASASQHSALTIYMLDSHGLTPDEKRYRGYDWVKPSQIEWFRTTAQGLKKDHEKYSHIHMDMAFIHIPIPEVAEREHNIQAGGSWKEPSTAPAFNSHFYDALTEEGVVAIGFGHDHVNDYCATRSAKAAAAIAAAAKEQDVTPVTPKKPHHGPWMCYAGGSGFGGYGGYNGYHRRVRVWEMDTGAARLMTWKRVECCGMDTKKKIDEIILVDNGHIVEDT